MKCECPDCDKVLQSVFYEGVQVQVCFGCRGFFLDEDKLAQIEESREIEIAKDSLAPSRRGGDINRTCPLCKGSMKKIEYGKINTTIIDKCEKCDGIWLDCGELDRIQGDYELCEDNREQNIRHDKHE